MREVYGILLPDPLDVHIGYNYNLQGDKGFCLILAGNFKTGRIEEEDDEEIRKFEVIKLQSQAGDL